MKPSRWTLRGGCGLLGLVLVLGAASGVRADDQQICSNVTLSGFNNSNVSVGFVTTDYFDEAAHSCSAGISSGCSACNSYSSPPKNVGFYLCIPNAMPYSIASSCQSLLTNGTNPGCVKNIMQFPPCPSNSSVVLPSCNWRTNDNTSDTSWNWELTYGGGSGAAITVTCSNTNLQGPEQ